MAGITTAFCTSAKAEFFGAGHNFNAPTIISGTAGSGSQSVTSAGSLTGVNVGMVITGTNIPANTVVSQITGALTFTISNATTGSISGGSLTVSGDVFNIALIKGSGVVGTYNASTTNYTDVTGNTDEVSSAGGDGYTTGGQALTNVSAVISSTTAYINFSPNPSWISATFSTTGCIIYNTVARAGGTSGTNTTGAGRAIGVFDFGGVQSVSAGTLTIIMPTPAAGTAVFRLS